MAKQLTITFRGRSKGSLKNLGGNPTISVPLNQAKQFIARAGKEGLRVVASTTRSPERLSSFEQKRMQQISKGLIKPKPQTISQAVPVQAAPGKPQLTQDDIRRRTIERLRPDLKKKAEQAIVEDRKIKFEGKEIIAVIDNFAPKDRTSALKTIRKQAELNEQLRRETQEILEGKRKFLSDEVSLSLPEKKGKFQKAAEGLTEDIKRLSDKASEKIFGTKKFRVELNPFAPVGIAIRPITKDFKASPGTIKLGNVNAGSIVDLASYFIPVFGVSRVVIELGALGDKIKNEEKLTTEDKIFASVVALAGILKVKGLSKTKLGETKIVSKFTDKVTSSLKKEGGITRFVTKQFKKRLPRIKEVEEIVKPLKPKPSKVSKEITGLLDDLKLKVTTKEKDVIRVISGKDVVKKRFVKETDNILIDIFKRREPRKIIKVLQDTKNKVKELKEIPSKLKGSIDDLKKSITTKEVEVGRILKADKKTGRFNVEDVLVDKFKIRQPRKVFQIINNINRQIKTLKQSQRIRFQNSLDKLKKSITTKEFEIGRVLKANKKTGKFNVEDVLTDKFKVTQKRRLFKEIDDLEKGIKNTKLRTNQKIRNLINDFKTKLTTKEVEVGRILKADRKTGKFNVEDVLVDKFKFRQKRKVFQLMDNIKKEISKVKVVSKNVKGKLFKEIDDIKKLVTTKTTKEVRGFSNQFEVIERSKKRKLFKIIDDLKKESKKIKPRLSTKEDITRQIISELKRPKPTKKPTPFPTIIKEPKPDFKKIIEERLNARGIKVKLSKVNQDFLEGQLAARFRNKPSEFIPKERQLALKRFNEKINIDVAGKIKQERKALNVVSKKSQKNLVIEPVLDSQGNIKGFKQVDKNKIKIDKDKSPSIFDVVKTKSGKEIKVFKPRDPQLPKGSKVTKDGLVVLQKTETKVPTISQKKSIAVKVKIKNKDVGNYVTSRQTFDKTVQSLKQKGIKPKAFKISEITEPINKGGLGLILIKNDFDANSPSQKIKVSEQIKPFEGVKEKEKVLIRENVNVFEGIAFREKIKEVVKEKIRERIKIKERVNERIREKTIQEPKIPKVPLVPILPKDNEKTLAKKGKSQGWIPQLIKSGRWKSIVAKSMSKRRAGIIAQSRVDNTIAATYRIIPKGTIKKVSKKENKFSKNSKFRDFEIFQKSGKRKKSLPKNTYIEFRKNRLDTIGEVKGIQAFPKKKRRKR